jgi:AraC family transcriptional regulator
MATAVGHDRLRTMIDVLVRSLDDPAQGEELARRAYLSRFHFDRLVAAALRERGLDGVSADPLDWQR